MINPVLAFKITLAIGITYLFLNLITSILSYKQAESEKEKKKTVYDFVKSSVIAIAALLLVVSFMEVTERVIKVNKQFSGSGILIVEKEYADRVGLPQKCSDYKVTKNKLGKEVYEFKVYVPEGAAFRSDDIVICNGQKLTVSGNHSTLVVISSKK